MNVIYRNTIGLATENTKGSQLEEMYAVCVYRTRCIGEIRPQLCSLSIVLIKDEFISAMSVKLIQNSLTYFCIFIVKTCHPF